MKKATRNEILEVCARWNERLSMRAETKRDPDAHERYIANAETARLRQISGDHPDGIKSLSQPDRR